MHRKTIEKLFLIFILTSVPTMAKGIYVGAGIAHVGDGVGGTYYLTGGLRVHLTENIAVEPEISYWRKSYEVSYIVPATGVSAIASASLSDVGLGVNAIYVYPVAEKLNVFGGLGLGLEFQSGSVETSVLGFDVLAFNGSNTEASFRLLGGVETSLNENLNLFGVIRYDVSDPSVFKAYGGVRFGF